MTTITPISQFGRETPAERNNFHDLTQPPPIFFDDKQRAEFSRITALSMQPSYALYATGAENALYVANVRSQPVNLNNNTDTAIAGALLFVGLIGLGILIGGTGGLAVVALGLAACGSFEKIGDPVDADGDGFIDKQFGGDDCDDSDKNIHPGITEICNGKDDNCDGKTDEGIAEERFYNGPADTQKFGTCKPKIQQCRNGIFVTTQKEVLPQNEIYDNKDNDCDGKTDENYKWIQVSAGLGHTCGVRADNSMACWGNNTNGESNPPSGAFIQVSAGNWHSCGIKTDNSVACWGKNTSGRDGHPSGAFIQISAGAVHTCGIKIDNSVACWGYNGDGASSPPSGAFIQVSAGAGSQHTCGVKADNSVACWGKNEYDQSSPPSGAFIQVSSGGEHTCGIRADNSVACWGYNGDDRSSPPSGAFTQVSAGGNHTCGIKADNSVACWGLNLSGQATPPPDNFIQVSAGGYHSCGVRADNSVACWGYDASGETIPPK